MSLMRATLSQPMDFEAGDPPSILTLLPSTRATLRTAAQYGRFEREEAELDDIKAKRPLGVPAPRDEPKSIHSPAGRSMTKFEPPVKRKASRPRSGGGHAGLPVERSNDGRSYHRPVRGSW